MKNPFSNISKPNITEKQIMDILHACYEKATEGVPGSKSCHDLAEEYLSKYKDPNLAIKKFISAQITKCTTSGFVTGLGGIVTIPVTLPANIISVLYIQLRMIATIAVIGGYRTTNDEVQTLAYLCLVGTSITDICKQAGINIANKTTTALLKKLPGSVLTKINQKIGFRLLTKFGEKGAINLVKLVPVVGGLFSASFDFAGTKTIANQAYKVFILNTIDDGVSPPEDIIDVEFLELEK